MKIVIILGCPSFGLSSFVSSPIRQVGPSFSRCVYAQDCSNKHQRQNQFSVDSRIGFSKERAGHFALNAKDDNFLFEEFSTAEGEVINPYKVLRLDKDAEKNDIRRSFRALSKMYHPDGVRFSDELPGECTHLNEVREEWDRIVLAKEILSDNKLRLRYDRNEAIHEALQYPVASVAKAAVDFMGWAVMGIGKELFNLGETAVKHAVTEMEKNTAQVAADAALRRQSVAATMDQIDSLTAIAKTAKMESLTSLASAQKVLNNSINVPPSTIINAGRKLSRSSLFNNHRSIAPTTALGFRENESNKLTKSLSRAALFSDRRSVAPTTSLSHNRDGSSDSFLLDDFKTADGEAINPYRVLKVDRNAERKEIKQSYKNLSKKYHPDGVRFREVMPGKCNNLDDVRNEWERIKLSYEILSDKKLRIKYDRHEAISDPLGAMGRATLNTMGWAVMGVGKGMFNLGGMAVKHMAEKKNEASTAPPSVGVEFQGVQMKREDII